MRREVPEGPLCEAGREVAKIHDLVILLEHVLPLAPEWELFRADLRFLTDFAVSYRYHENLVLAGWRGS